MCYISALLIAADQTMISGLASRTCGSPISLRRGSSSAASPPQTSIIIMLQKIVMMVPARQT